MFKKIISKRITEWERECALLLKIRDIYCPVGTLRYEWKTLAYEIWRLKIAIWKEIGGVK